MDPVSPVINGMESEEAVYAKDQPQYIPLPCLRSKVADGRGRILTRWKFTKEEREAIADGADLFLSVLTHHQPLQPLQAFVHFDDEGLLKYFLEHYR